MKIQSLSDVYSVSDQITQDDIEELATNNIEIIICNRPDNEAENQPLFSEIENAAASKNIQTINIPFSADTLSPTQIEELRQLLHTGKKIHAYCRTGNRSTIIWQEALSKDISLLQKEEKDMNKSESLEKQKSKSVEKPAYDVVIVGAGSGGIAAAASLLKRRSSLRIALIDPTEKHYYQPGWTMVGGGVFNAASTEREMKDLIPNNTTWIQQRVVSFQPNENKVSLSNEQEIFYKQLIVAPGITLNWKAIEGLEETLGKNGVTSNYRYDLAPYTWQLVNSLKKGTAIFTQPPMPIKCAGAPQKAMYLSSDHWYKHNQLNDIDLHFFNAGGVLFGVNDYVPALENYVKKYNANMHYLHNLKRIDGNNKTAYFSTTDKDGNETIIEKSFDMIHVCPPQCSPDFIANSELSDEAGWLDVNPDSLQSNHFNNIWGLGDVMNTTNAKTMAAVRKQVPVVANNVIDALDGKPSSYVYDGYGSCPLTVERGKIVLAEFGYGGKLLPTFPKWLNNGTKPTKFAWFLKKTILPFVYWQGMLKGREWLASPEKKKA